MSYPLRREYLVSYDVEDNKVRTAVHKELLKYGMFAVQRSVFWGCLTAAELAAVRRFLAAKLAPADRAFAVRCRFGGEGEGFLVGHAAGEFVDWEETGVV